MVRICGSGIRFYLSDPPRTGDGRGATRFPHHLQLYSLTHVSHWCLLLQLRWGRWVVGVLVMGPPSSVLFDWWLWEFPDSHQSGPGSMRWQRIRVPPRFPLRTFGQRIQVRPVATGNNGFSISQNLRTALSKHSWPVSAWVVQNESCTLDLRRALMLMLT